VDKLSKNKRSWVMAQVKSSSNKTTEMKLINAFRQDKINGWRRNYKLLGKPDFVFPERKLTIFVDGCFWHGHPTKCRIPHTNRKYWVNKIKRNQMRDKLVNKELRKLGWTVLRIWEHKVDECITLTRIKMRLRQYEKHKMGC
jgi:DNA mismatch endonuclease, patch repair protein